MLEMYFKQKNSFKQFEIIQFLVLRYAGHKIGPHSSKHNYINILGRKKIFLFIYSQCQLTKTSRAAPLPGRAGNMTPSEHTLWYSKRYSALCSFSSLSYFLNHCICIAYVSFEGQIMQIFIHRNRLTDFNKTNCFSLTAWAGISI